MTDPNTTAAPVRGPRPGGTVSLTDDQLTELERAIAEADEASTPFHPEVNYPTFVADSIAPLIESWQTNLLNQLTRPATIHAAASARMSDPTAWWKQVTAEIITAAANHVRSDHA